MAGSRIQVLASKERGSYARATVEVHEHFDGSLTIHYAGQQLAATEAPPEAPKLRSRGGRLRHPTAGTAVSESDVTADSSPAHLASASAPRPAEPHPWRKWTGPAEQAKSLASS